MQRIEHEAVIADAENSVKRKDWIAVNIEDHGTEARGVSLAVTITTVTTTETGRMIPCILRILHATAQAVDPIISIAAISSSQPE